MGIHALSLMESPLEASILDSKTPLAYHGPITLYVQD
jgi:hypothetical protein